MLSLIQRRLLKGACLALALSAALAGCGKNPEELTASARSRIENHEYKAAAIELRDALQKNANLAEARYLLGVALMNTNDWLAAEKELRKAAELGYAEDKVLPELARTMITTRQAQKVIEEFGGKQLAEPGAVASLATSLGDAYLATGKQTEAADAYAKALAAQPSHAMAKLGQARLAALSRDLPRAEQITTQVLAESPDRAEAWTLKAQLAVADNKPEEAIASYRKAVESKPDDLDARLALGLALLQQGQEEAATAEADAMAKLSAGDPRTKLLQSQIAFKQRKYAEARDLAMQVLRVMPAHIPSLRTAGAAHFFLGSDQQAQDQLNKVVLASKGDLLARRLLIASYVRSGDLPRAKRVLKEGLDLAPKDPGLLVLAGEVAVAERDLEGAMEEYEAALSEGDGNAALMTRLGQLHLAAGEDSEAIKILEAASAADDEQYQSELLLVIHYLKQGKPAEALPWVEKIEQKRPQDPLGPTLRGAVQLASKDETAARASFEKALQLQPAFTSALMYLARLDLRANNAAAADARFRKALEKEPANEAATLAYDGFLRAQGASAQQRKEVLTRFLQKQPRSIRGRVALIGALLEAGEAQNAVTTAQEGLATDPDNPALLRAAGAAELLSDHPTQAVATFSKLATIQPQSPLPHVLAAYANVKAGDDQRALDSLERALRIKRDYVPAQIPAARLYLKLGKPDAALGIARDLQKQHPKAAIGYVLEANILSQGKRFADADRVLDRGLDQAPEPALAITRYRLLLSANQPEQGNKFADEWLAAHPQDVAFRAELAQRAMVAGDYAEAARQYRTVVSLSPKNVIALNNLAWASGKLNDPKAIEYAEQAHALAPDSPAVLDTLGWLLVEKGELDRGIGLLRKAVQLAPKENAIRFNLAKALVRTGDKGAARKELELLAKQGDNIPAQKQKEVQELLNSL